MHWLEALDTGLFHFINRSLSNPLCDYLMPVLSGGHGAMPWFMLAVLAAFAAALIFGNARARLCALMIFLAVTLGDSLVINTIKHAIARPRPCVALPDVVERLGCSNSGSMPSSHAANWFATAMIVFIFYRRKRYLTLPVLFMAAAVSFSRVYNGVHYPGDVLAGAILGAGYAVALAVALETGWQFAGREWFPLWHERMPSLLTPEAGSAGASPYRPEQPLHSELGDAQWLRLGVIVIVVSLLAQWAYLASGAIELSEDEAYQWVWSKHLALSYYSKPPGIAWIQFAGTHLWGETEFGVRFFSPLFAAILSLMALRFVARETGARAAFWLLLIVNAVPMLSVGTILMTIDSPLLLCWTWALVAGWRAAQPAGRTRDWLAVGVAMGLAFLCKYSALYQIVCFTAFFALWPPARIHLFRPGPWLALLIFLICALPVVVWNAQHHWITAYHVAGNAGMGTRWRLRWNFFRDFWLEEAPLLNPVFFIAALWAMFAFWRFRRERPLMLYLFCMSAPVFFGHAIYSLRSRILPNWIATAVPVMFMLMTVYWTDRLRAGSRVVKPALAAGLALGFCAVALLFDSRLVGKIAGAELPGAVDPSRRVSAWKPAAALVEAEREKLEEQGKPAFIIAGHYGITSLLTFYSPPARKALALKWPLVYCVDSDAPENQFFFWPEYNYRAAREGENAIYVMDIGPDRLPRGWSWKWLRKQPIAAGPASTPATPQRLLAEFETVTDLGDREIRLDGRVFHRLHLWACYGLKE